MKRALRSLALATVLGAALASPAIADCGVGTTIWDNSQRTAHRVLAFTTNLVTFYVLSTTFESSGCTESDNIFKRASSAEVRYFAGRNLDRLAVDMARGRGEYVDAFAYVIGLAEEDRSTFRALAKRRFEALFPHDHVTSNEMVATLGRLMAEDETLKVYVHS